MFFKTHLMCPDSHLWGEAPVDLAKAVVSVMGTPLQ